MPEEAEYVLGTDDEELARLRVQHQAWVEQAYALWRRAGLREGQCVLDLGCGPGFTSLELAHVVGPTGRIVARDASARFLAFLDLERQRAVAPIRTSLGPVEDLELAAGSFDAAYARWLFSWLSDPVRVARSVAAGLRPGGALVLQEYLDWATMKLVPREPLFDRVIEVCMQSWADSGGHIDVADLVPEIAHAAGLAVEHFAPVARIGAVGSLEWRWLGGFFASYLPRLVQRGQLEDPARETFTELWRRREESRAGYVVAPTLADAILRKHARG